MFALSELVDSDDSGARTAIGLQLQVAMGERADAMCGVECYSNAGPVDQVQVQLAGDRGRMHRTNGSSSLLEKVDSLLCRPPSPQPASLDVLKGAFLSSVVPVFLRQIKAPWSILGRQVASRLPASKTKLRKTSSAHTEVATMETEMRNLTLKRNRLLTTECRVKGEDFWELAHRG